MIFKVISLFRFLLTPLLNQIGEQRLIKQLFKFGQSCDQKMHNLTNMNAVLTYQEEPRTGCFGKSPLLFEWQF